MGFYDLSIKTMMKKCPRLIILAVNSIFGKNYDEHTEVEFLDNELIEGQKPDSRYMDMLIAIEDDEFHWEFQLAEGHMSVRMYEYGTKETLRRLKRDGDTDRYELHVEMPEQVVVFLAGVNKRDEITVVLRLPDRQTVTYKLPCVSAAVSVGSLIEDKLYMLIPFQQVQLNDRMNHIKNRSSKTKLRMAAEIHQYHLQVKTALENLMHNAIITSTEYEILLETFANVEKYLRDKDNEVDKVVSDMGDENYIPWSERVRAEAKAEAKAEFEIEVAEKDAKLAEQDERIRELERQLAELRK
jgi:hypothetical protein